MHGCSLVALCNGHCSGMFLTTYNLIMCDLCSVWIFLFFNKWCDLGLELRGHVQYSIQLQSCVIKVLELFAQELCTMEPDKVISLTRI